MAKEYTLIVNTKNGYCLTPSAHTSINSAYKSGRESCGFAFRIFDKNKNVVKRGFCN